MTTASQRVSKELLTEVKYLQGQLKREYDVNLSFSEATRAYVKVNQGRDYRIRQTNKGRIIVIKR